MRLTLSTVVMITLLPACGSAKPTRAKVAAASDQQGSAPGPGADTSQADPLGVAALPGGSLIGSTTIAPARVRRLTAVEITHAANQVFLGDRVIALALAGDAVEKGAFDNRIDALGVTTPFLDALQTAAESIAAAAVTQVDKLTSCAVASKSEDQCLQSFLDTVGRRAYRRPLTSDERQILTALFKKTRTGDDYPTAIATVVETLIQSPQFLFRSETGDTGDGVVALTPYETASALSFFLWRSAPDDALLNAAADGHLTSPDEIAAQTTRMLADPKAMDGMWNFFSQWMTIAEPSALSAARITAFPSFTPAVANAAVNDFKSFIRDQILGSKASYRKLLTSNAAVVSNELAPIYGVAASPSSLTVLDQSQRAGIFTSIAFLSSLSSSVDFSPVHFGVFVATQVFCNDIPPPPPGIPPVAKATTSTTARERFKTHATSANCAGCHSRFEPAGWAFEQFNGIGGFDPVDNGTTLDGAGAVAGTDVDQTFKGPVQLAGLVAKSQTAASCFASKWLEYAVGRPVSLAAKQLSVDKMAIAAGAKALVSTDSITQMIINLTQSDAFLKRDRSKFNATAP